MNWTQVSIATTSAGVDAVCGNLLQLGVEGFEIQDPEDFKEFLTHKTGNWDYVDDSLLALGSGEGACVTIYLPDNAQGVDLLTALRGAMGRLRAADDGGAFGALTVSLANVREEDWANNWKQYFKPFRVGERFVIKPSWEPCSPEPGRVILEIDPASSFGTGQHHTTRLCLEQLEHVVKPGCTVLDMGCGSGILSAAALLLGAGHVTAVDIDENAVRTADENVRANGGDDSRFAAYCGNVLGDEALVRRIGGGYDVVVANIVADVIIAMSGLLKSFLKPGGTLIVSGIITMRAREVADALAQSGLILDDTRELEDWNALIAHI